MQSGGVDEKSMLWVGIWISTTEGGWIHEAGGVTDVARSEEFGASPGRLGSRVWWLPEACG